MAKKITPLSPAQPQVQPSTNAVRPLTLRIINARVYVVEPSGSMRLWGSKVGDVPVDDSTAPTNDLPLWTPGVHSDSWTTEISCRPEGGFKCPKCQKIVAKKHLVKTDKDASGEDTCGWHFKHPCGAKLLIIND